MLTGNNGILEQTKNAKENTNLAKKEEEKNLYDIPESEIQNVDWTTKDEDGAYSIQTQYNQFVWIAVENERAEKDAVLEYNGFYIFRYEVGDLESSIVSKQYVKPYASKHQIQFKEIAKTIYNKDSDSVRSVMCSGIQWDIVMNFNNGKNDGNGNKYDVRTISDKNHIKK